MREELKKVNTAYLYCLLIRELYCHIHGLDLAILLQIRRELEEVGLVGVAAGPISRSI